MYALELEPRAESDLKRLDATIRKRIFQSLADLCETCETRPHHALRGPHRGKFRIVVARVYRVIYTFDKSTREVTVHRIRHRSRAYD